MKKCITNDGYCLKDENNYCPANICELEESLIEPHLDWEAEIKHVQLIIRKNKIELLIQSKINYESTN